MSLAEPSPRGSDNGYLQRAGLTPPRQRGSGVPVPVEIREQRMRRRVRWAMGDALALGAVAALAGFWACVDDRCSRLDSYRQQVTVTGNR